MSLIVVGALVLLGLFIAALARGGFVSAGEAGERAVSAILREDLDQHRYKVLDNIMLKRRMHVKNVRLVHGQFD